MQRFLTIIDAPCGTGKTNAAINYINSFPNKRFMFVTPYLSEVKRVRENTSCVEPCNNKMNDLKGLIKKKCNIVTTHALFMRFHSLNLQGYTLILDESISVVKCLNVHKDDVKIILSQTSVGANGIVKWNNKEYCGTVLAKYKEYADSNSLYFCSDCLYTLYPISVFKSFDETILLTYMFNSQIIHQYFKMFDFKIQHKYISSNYSLVKEVVNYHVDFSRIKIYEGKLNDIGNEYYSLSKTWYTKATQEELIKVKNNLYNFYRNICKKSDKHDFMWTTFADYQDVLTSKGVVTSFTACNLRATNEYCKVHNIAYLVNVFPNPSYKDFFPKLDDDKYALGELIQYIFRSAIRNKDNSYIFVYIPSMRMRNLLKEYINVR